MPELSLKLIEAVREQLAARSRSALGKGERSILEEVQQQLHCELAAAPTLADEHAKKLADADEVIRVQQASGRRIKEMRAVRAKRRAHFAECERVRNMNDTARSLLLGVTHVSQSAGRLQIRDAEKIVADCFDLARLYQKACEDLPPELDDLELDDGLD